MDSECYVNQRRSYNGDLCTVRYVGKVEGTTGEWLGVEWDDPTRGKHSGEHNGVRYFTCRSKHLTPGSFVRPSRRSERPQGFLEALRQKYASGFEEEVARQKEGISAAADASRDAIKFSNKVVEEVGFDKIRKKLAELQELKIVLLDGLRVAGVLAHAAGPEERKEACRDIEATCSKIMELDLSYNLLERWTEVADMCHCLKHLRKLKLIGNRLGPPEEGLVFDGITQLHLDETLLSWNEISALTHQFTSLSALSASANQITEISSPIAGTITTLILENNDISSLASLKSLTSLDKLEHLSLRENRIDTVYGKDSNVKPIKFSQSLISVDLSRNIIDSWSFVNELHSIFPGLQSLRISGNPLYDKPVASSTITGLPEKPMTVDEAYILTLARLSSIETLNYSKITPQDRSNGEMYYLSLIGKELSAYPESSESEILDTHPRYHELCEKYGPPTVKRASDSAGAAVNPRSIAARLVKLIFHLNSSAFSETREQQIKTEKIPRSFHTYQVKAIASRLFNLPPYQCRLVWETDELDPVSQEKREDEDDWDSDDDGPIDTMGDNSKPTDLSETPKFVKREVELVDSTRDIGFWFQPDIHEARIRIEVPT